MTPATITADSIIASPCDCNFGVRNTGRGQPGPHACDRCTNNELHWIVVPPCPNPYCTDGRAFPPSVSTGKGYPCEACRGVVVADLLAVVERRLDDGLGLGLTRRPRWGKVVGAYWATGEPIPVVGQPSDRKGQPFICPLPDDPQGQSWIMYAPNGSISPSDGGAVMRFPQPVKPGDSMVPVERCSTEWHEEGFGLILNDGKRWVGPFPAIGEAPGYWPKQPVKEAA